MKQTPLQKHGTLWETPPDIAWMAKSVCGAVITAFRYVRSEKIYFQFCYLMTCCGVLCIITFLRDNLCPTINNFHSCLCVCNFLGTCDPIQNTFFILLISGKNYEFIPISQLQIFLFPILDHGTHVHLWPNHLRWLLCSNPFICFGLPCISPKNFPSFV